MEGFPGDWATAWPRPEQLKVAPLKAGAILGGLLLTTAAVLGYTYHELNPDPHTVRVDVDCSKEIPGTGPPGTRITDRQVKEGFNLVTDDGYETDERHINLSDWPDLYSSKIQIIKELPHAHLILNSKQGQAQVSVICAINETAPIAI